MRLMTLQQYVKMSKPALIRKITNTIRKMPKKRLAVLCYNITKSKLPRLRTIRQKQLTLQREIRKGLGKKGYADYKETKRLGRPFKTKRKFSRKQLAAQRLFAKRARAGTLRRR